MDNLTCAHTSDDVYDIFLDFDGTITTADVCHAMVKALAGEGWQAINQRWENREISTTECARQTFRTFRSNDPEAILKIAESVPLEKGFGEFVKVMKAAGHRLYILSDGYELYIHHLLKKAGISLPVYANRIVFNPEIDIETPHHEPDCGHCGVCKCQLIRRFSVEGRKTIYIGDGVSDYCPVRKVDIVFARKQLLDFCRREGISARAYDDFYQVMHLMEALGKAGD
ncbi:MtnX-like HAD-IB family phosphatase [Anoxynatronum buryatiense]|uniref:Haloacid Dehalogenase superfamily, subfamily IB, phosphoserine phosphatase-like/2,3-diketo-5-methylthio-1-phosphopentane phosphatase n=1 Tax=Anoxynatronum buryatiense TaxID=489973 RepID=A0AA45WWZ3_9CLOT|nr:MtnX-like HAD-IB family phosphatase [Anoxynatronum buryatiense]SMP61735.1 Haloacid Dehalogenase superfamily, subfamily IB, phosphoserine phosphatase-like/2,3-diketo-5-methylthio-1-phosphopentane phosphatase [Anoxynatronum buryatiense]